MNNIKEMIMSCFTEVDITKKVEVAFSGLQRICDKWYKPASGSDTIQTLL